MSTMHKYKVLEDFKIVAVNFYTEPDEGNEPLYTHSSTLRETDRIKRSLCNAWEFVGGSDVDKFLQDCNVAKIHIEHLYRGPQGHSQESCFKESWNDALLEACEFVIESLKTKPKTDREHAIHALKRNNML